MYKTNELGLSNHFSNHKGIDIHYTTKGFISLVVERFKDYCATSMVLV
jgi:hypothetical protein